MTISNYTKSDSFSQPQNRKIDIYLILTLLLIAFHVSGNIIWINLNQAPPTWDAALHTVLSIKFLNYLKSNLFSFNLIDFLRISQYYPPAVHWVGMIFAFIGEFNYKFIQFTGTVFFAMALLFQYLLVKELFKDKRVAFLSAFILSFFITVYQQSRNDMLDVPLTAFILAGLYFLFRSAMLTNKINSALFFIFFSLAFLTKWYSLIYFFIPLLIFFSQFLKEKKTSYSVAKNFLIGFMIFSLICLPWYFINLKKIIEIGKVTATPELADPQRILSLENFLFNLKLIIMFQTSFIGFLFFLASLFMLFIEKNHRKVKLMVFLVLALVYIFFTLLPNKNIRYTIPLMPFLALVMGFGLNKLIAKLNMVNQALTSFLIFYFVASYFILSFGIPLYPNYKYSVNFPLIGPLDIYYLDHYPVELVYNSKVFAYGDLVKDISRIKKGKINILLLKDTEQINNGILDPLLYRSTRNRTENFYYIGYDLLLDKKSNVDIQNYLENNVDVILVSKNYIGLKEAIREYPSVEKFRTFFLREGFSKFVLVNKYILPAGYSEPNDLLFLYKRADIN